MNTRYKSHGEAVAFITVEGKEPHQTYVLPGCTTPADAKDLAARLYGEGVDFVFSCVHYGIHRRDVSKLYVMC